MIYKYILFVFFVLLVSCQKPGKLNYYEMDINNGWMCRMAPDSAWISAEVPGNILADLKYNGIMDSIMEVDKISQIQSLLHWNWEYKVVFDVPLDILAQDSIYLQFEGVAEIADILLNEKPCIRANNMFKTYIIPCKRLLKEYKNVLRVQFKPPQNPNNIKPNTRNRPAYDSVQKSRKAFYFDGSEINRGIPFLGIWKPVKLIAWSEAIIKDVYFETQSISPGAAVVEANIDIESKKAGYYIIGFEINKQPVKETYNVNLKKGKQTVKIKIQIDNPDLWWCKGMGKQILYEAITNLSNSSGLISQKSNRFGIRKIEKIEQSDSFGYNFFFKLNGKAVFIKGGAFVPFDLFDFSKAETQYPQIICDAASANMNLLRVWGGGFYESDLFYDLCDKNGIMVWQDLPFSCNSSMENKVDTYALKDEVSENIGRIRNHPSLIMLFANSDISTNADFKTNKLLPKRNYVKSDCIQFFSEQLPQLIREKCNIPFNSACKANEKESKEVKPIRDWRVWYDAAPLAAYSENHGGFFLEYGMQSFPDRKTIPLKSNFGDWGLIPNEANNFQFCQLPWLGFEKNGNQLIMDYLQMYYNDPIDFPAAIYLSQLLQAQALKNAIENQRLRKPFCMGTIFWHFNDCAPGITWSVMDYYNRQKPAYFAVKNAYKNIVVIPERLNGDIRLWAVNDSIDDFDGECILSLMDFNGKILFIKKLKVSISSEQTQILWLVNEENLMRGKNANNLFLEVILMKNNQKVDENILYFSDPKYFDLPVPDIKCVVEAIGNCYRIKLNSNQFAKNVVLSTINMDVRFSDNNLDLLPGRTYYITTDYVGTKKELENDLKIMSLIDSY